MFEKGRQNFCPIIKKISHEVNLHPDSRNPIEAPLPTYSSHVCSEVSLQPATDSLRTVNAAFFQASHIKGYNESNPTVSPHC